MGAVITNIMIASVPAIHAAIQQCVDRYDLAVRERAMTMDDHMLDIACALRTLTLNNPYGCPHAYLEESVANLYVQICRV